MRARFMLLVIRFLKEVSISEDYQLKIARYSQILNGRVLKTYHLRKLPECPKFIEINVLKLKYTGCQTFLKKIIACSY